MKPGLGRDDNVSCNNVQYAIQLEDDLTVQPPSTVQSGQCLHPVSISATKLKSRLPASVYRIFSPTPASRTGYAKGL